MVSDAKENEINADDEDEEDEDANLRFLLAPSPSTMPAQRVFVGNIPNSSRERDLEKFFKGYGRITDVVVKSGYGFVEFDNYR